MSCEDWIAEYVSDRTIGREGINLVNRQVFGFADRVDAGEPFLASLSAPRDSGKSTSIRAMIAWAVCELHVNYVVIVGESAKAVQRHLRAIRRLFANPKVLSDYPHVAPRARVGSKATEQDSASSYVNEAGQAIEAVGFGGSIIGALIDDRRPDMIVLDDIAGGKTAAKTRSALQVEYLTEDLLPALAHDRHWLFQIGTPQTPGNLADLMVRHCRGELDPGEADWINEEGFETYVVDPITADGESFWPERYTAEQLHELSLLASFGYRFDSRPGSPEGWWAHHNFEIGELPDGSPDFTLCSLDTIKRSGGSSDAAAVVCYLWKGEGWHDSVIGIMSAAKAFDPAAGTRGAVLQCMSEAPFDIGVIESNATGELALLPLEGILADWFLQNVSDRKVDRAAALLNEFQAGPRIVFAKALPAVIGEMRAYQGEQGDTADYIDALGLAISRLKVLQKPRRRVINGIYY